MGGGGGEVLLGSGERRAVSEAAVSEAAVSEAAVSEASRGKDGLVDLSTQTCWPWRLTFLMTKATRQRASPMNMVLAWKKGWSKLGGRRGGGGCLGFRRG